MSDFLLIVPAGWTQLDWQYITSNIPNMSYGEVINGITSDIENNLKAAGIVAQEASLIEFKLIDDAYFLVRLG